MQGHDVDMDDLRRKLHLRGAMEMRLAEQRQQHDSRIPLQSAAPFGTIAIAVNQQNEPATPPVAAQRAACLEI